MTCHTLEKFYHIDGHTFENCFYGQFDEKKSLLFFLL